MLLLVLRPGHKLEVPPKEVHVGGGDNVAGEEGSADHEV